MASPEWNTAGSPVKICFNASGWEKLAMVPKSGFCAVNASPYSAATRSSVPVGDRSQRSICTKPGALGPGGSMTAVFGPPAAGVNGSREGQRVTEAAVPP